MSDTDLPGLMELDSFWEKAVWNAVEDTIYDRKKLEFALENRSKINKRLESLGYHITSRPKKRAKKVSDVEDEEEGEDEDEDGEEEDGEEEVSEADSLNESDSADSMGDDLESYATEVVRNRRKGHKPRGKISKGTSEDNKIKKSHLEFDHEPMDAEYGDDDEDEDEDDEDEDEDEDEDDEDEDEDEDGISRTNIFQLKQTPYNQAKRKLDMMMTELKRKKKKSERRLKGDKKRSKSCKAKKSNRLVKKGGQDNKRENKSEADGKMKSEGNKSGGVVPPPAAVVKDIVKTREGKQEGAKEAPGDNKEEKTHRSTEKEPQKNHPAKEVEPKESDYRYGSMTESEQSCWSASVLGDDDFS